MPVTTPTAENCQYYARFMSSLLRPQAEGIYWVFFFLVLFLLFTASWKYGRTLERIEHLACEDRERIRLLTRLFWVCLATGFLALGVVVLEAFVINTLQFCDGEPLVSLYWSLWTMLQVGGLIAVWGICLHVRHMVTGKKHPPWALALGTPVLVVAGLGHYFQAKLRKSRAARSIPGRNRSHSLTAKGRVETLGEVLDSTDSNSGTHNGDSPMTYGDCGDDDFNAKVIGYTKDGDIIIRLAQNLRDEFRSQIPASNSIIIQDEPIRSASSKAGGNATIEHTRPRDQRSPSSVVFKIEDKVEDKATIGRDRAGQDNQKGLSVKAEER